MVLSPQPWIGVLLVWLLAARAAGDLVSDGNILLAFKAGLVDPEGSLRSWSSSASPCSWEGVACNSTADGITGLTINSTSITGPLDGRVCGISSLQALYFADTNFTGTFPEGLFNCSNLTTLTIRNTSLGGPLPDGFSALQSLVELDLGLNSFSGRMPSSIGDLPQLQWLHLEENLFATGGVPTSYGKLSKLQELYVNDNQLAGPLPDLSNLTELQLLRTENNGLLDGRFPDSILVLTQLTYLDLTNNSFSGEIPEAIGNLKNLVYLYLGANKFSGSIPQAITQLTSLQMLYLYSNQLTGDFPPGMDKLVNMTDFLAQQNTLTGVFPQEWTQWKELATLDINTNNITGSIPPEFGNLTELASLSVFSNRLNGTLPQNLGANANFRRLEAGFNSFWGPVPPHLCAGGKLATLAIQSNMFSGDFPSTYDSCTSMTGLSTANNSITGNLPLGLWASPRLFFIDISSNNYSGIIPPQAGAATTRFTLKISDNQFSGALPAELGQAAGLVQFEASRNRLEGAIPSSLGNLAKLQTLSLDSNQLSDAIPSELGRCSDLTTLNLADNQLSGSIPETLAELPSLNSLDLSNNRLTGHIPAGLRVLSPLNLSDNELSGPLPPAYATGQYADSFAGNPGLCGEGLGAGSRPCPLPSSSGHHSPRTWPWIVAGTFAAAAAILLAGCCCWCRKYARHRRVKEREAWTFRSFQKVEFGLQELLLSLEEGNVIGSGAAGKVYKVLLPDGQTVAVKRLRRPQPAPESKHADLGFEAEVETLGKNTRHRNIVKLLCCCSNSDSNILVYEYMRRGSLGQALHEDAQQVVLDWPDRHRIAVGAASALEYLHHQCVPQILHRDVKANNILLDDNLEACVADFGLAKVLETYSAADDIVTGVAGSHGYIAPEYGYTFKITEKSDIYSFGVVLLELVTGRQPIDSKVYGEGESLAAWAAGLWQRRQEQLMQYPGADRDGKEVMELLLDSRLASGKDDHTESMLQVLQLGLLCTSPVPSQRPSARVVVEILQQCGPEVASAKSSKAPSRQTSKRRPDV